MSLRIVAPVFWRCFTVAGGFFFVFVWAGVLASARDLGQWGNQDPATRKWFNSLKSRIIPGCHAAEMRMPIGLIVSR